MDTIEKYRKRLGDMEQKESGLTLLEKKLRYIPASKPVNKPQEIKRIIEENLSEAKIIEERMEKIEPYLDEKYWLYEVKVVQKISYTSIKLSGEIFKARIDLQELGYICYTDRKISINYGTNNIGQHIYNTGNFLEFKIVVHFR